MELLHELLDWLGMAFAGPRVFMILVRDGEVRIRKGEVGSGFCRECADVLHNAGISRARVSGHWNYGKMDLRFSRQVPENIAQRIRNIWSVHR